MPSDAWVYLLIFIASVFVSSLAQVLLKISAGRPHEGIVREYVNPMVIIGYTLFLAATLVTVFAYKQLPLSMGPALESLGYVFVGLLGFFILQERMGKKKILGMALIVAGTIIFAL